MEVKLNRSECLLARAALRRVRIEIEQELERAPAGIEPYFRDQYQRVDALMGRIDGAIEEDAKTRPYPQMAREFYTYDQDTLPPIPADWVDQSYHNDACPRFAAGRTTADDSEVDPQHDDTLEVFIDWPNPEDREIDCGFRYILLLECETLLQSNWWADILAKVDELRKRPYKPV